MAFVVEDGTGVAGANAYATLSEVRGYWADRGVTLTDDDAALQGAIVITTQYIDQNNEFYGSITHQDQNLCWPRSGVTDRKGRTIGSQTVPSEIKNAVAEYARRQLTYDDGIQPDVPDSGAVIREKKKVDVIETETQYSENSAGYFGIRRYPQGDKWLIGLVKNGVLGNFGVVGGC